MEILSAILAEESAKKSDLEKALWLVRLTTWIRKTNENGLSESKIENLYTARLKYLLLLVNKNEAWKNNFVQTISDVLLRSSASLALTTVGISPHSSFLQDALGRVQNKLLPSAALSDDLSQLLYEIFPDEQISLLVDFIDEQILSEILALFSHKDVLIGRLQKDLLSAAYVLSVQLLNSSFSALNELRFFREDLAQLSEFQLEGMLRNQLEKGEMFAPEKALELLKVIEEHTDSLYESMHSRGVKIELVYLFENQKRKIRRLRSLLLFAHADPVARARNFRYFISHLILDIHHQSSLKSFLSENFALLTDRIVQANSTVGEHYVTHTWLQFKRMFRSALGGGAITAGTVIMKVLIGKIGLVGFLKGLFDSFNYAGSFLAIQMMGWTLATKQPSATAPYIASALQKSISDARRAIVAVLRTQFIAVWGNLSMVFPVCLFLSWGTYYFGMPILTAEEAMYLFDSTSLLGPSALFAAFTGVLLFTASLIAGWFENWVIVNQIENRIKNNERFYRLFGAKLVQKISSVVGQKSNAIAANISLGFLLGMVPQFLKFMNLPLDVRHVTLAMGGFASSLPIVIDLGVSIPEILSSLLGIFLIGLLNISVSFSLAFLLASISSKVRFSSFVHLFKWGVKLFITRPWLLVVPEDRNSEKHSG